MPQSLATILGSVFILTSHAMVMARDIAHKPNIILVLVDDMGYGDPGCFGGPGVTPNLDRLASEGLRFRNFYVSSPICSPSRAALTTGQYPHRLRITSYLDNRERNSARGVAQWLDPDTVTLSDRLQSTGYRTGHFGKWHLGGQRDVADAPLITEYGFDESLTNFEGLGPRVLPLNHAWDGTEPRRHDLGSAALGRGPIRWVAREQVTSEYVRAAMDFIRDSADAEKSFYINLWPDDVHSPFFPSESARKATDGSKRALYYAVLHEMDLQLGPMFDMIRNDAALKNNTLIVVASDNGHEEGAGQSGILRGGKTWLYEGGIRSPLIVWGPGLLAQDAASLDNTTSVLSAMDLHCSLASLAGVPIGDHEICDGEDLIPTLLGYEKADRSSPIFWRRPPDRPGDSEADNPDLAVREGPWKCLVNLDRSSPQLFDLKTDPSEKNNLASAHPEVTARLVDAMLSWNASMPVDATDPAFEPQWESLHSNQFVNPIAEGADPWVVRDPNSSKYLWCLSDGNRAIAIHAGERLTSLGPKHIVWMAPDSGPWSKEIWAPELHMLDGHWHIYFAASDGRNENHLAYVVRSEGADPFGPYALHGPFSTGDGADGLSPNIWAIDMTVFEHRERRYAVWSGWDAPGTDRQYLYIAPMKSPTELAGPRVRLCPNDDFEWERTEPGIRGRGLNEGPQVLRHRNRTFLTYSCAASWLPSYKLGLLELTGDDPLQPDSWKKFPKPVFNGTAETYGVGHSCFVRSPDESEWWHVFHAKRDQSPGWQRGIFIQPMQFGPARLPLLGAPVKAGTPLKRPSGETSSLLQIPFRNQLKTSAELSHGSYFGHHQYLAATPQGLELGHPAIHPVNEYRCGEKFVLNQQAPDNLSAGVTIEFLNGRESRDAGMLFRTTAPSVGYDAQRGYFAGLIPKTNLVILGRMDGTHWTELARATASIDAAQPQDLRVHIRGNAIEILHNGRSVLKATDNTWRFGTIGLRVVDTHARFSELWVEAN